ncbi:hypothetical protein QUB19_10480 [Microcoleus sp. B4-C5]|uniref:hypothetical protein n=1 Tax=unclassified Microcoleus TaxID=2642155 RepID=UPI002FD7162A
MRSPLSHPESQSAIALIFRKCDRPSLVPNPSFAATLACVSQLSAFMRTCQSSIAFLIPNPKGAIAPFPPHIPKAIALILFTRAHIQLVNMITYQQNRCTIVRI